MGESVESIYGDLPAHWRMARLRDLIDSGDAELKTGPFGTLLQASAYKSSGTPVIAVQHLGENRLKHCDLPRIDDLTLAGLATYRVREGDILFGRKGAVDRRALIGADESGWLIGSDIIRLRWHGAMDPRFCSYVFGSRAYKDWAIRHAHGATMPSLNQEILGLIPLPLPPLPVQHAIASVLGSLDDKIELNRRMNATLEAMARALFQSWFVDFDPVRARLDGRRPPGLDPATAALFPDSFQDSPLGPIPKGWEVRRVGEMVEGLYDGPHATPPESDSGAMFLGIKNLTGTAIDFSDERHISEAHWPKWTRRVTPSQGDIVFSYEATLGFFALVPQGLRCCLGRRLALIRCLPKSGYPHFWFHQFVSVPFQRFLDQHAVYGATVNRISLTEFPRYSVLNPPQSLKTKFEQFAEPIWRGIHANQRESRTLAALRDALLPRLLSGEVSVEALT